MITCYTTDGYAHARYHDVYMVRGRYAYQRTNSSCQADTIMLYVVHVLGHDGVP